MIWLTAYLRASTDLIDVVDSDCLEPLAEQYTQSTAALDLADTVYVHLLILSRAGHENNTAQPKQVSDSALYLIFHRFSPFIC